MYFGDVSRGSVAGLTDGFSSLKLLERLLLSCFAQPRVRLASSMEALASIFEEGTPSIVPKIINGALVVGSLV